MSYDISYFKKETYNNPGQRKLVEVAPFLAEGGTVRAELVDGKLVPASITECEMNITYNYSKLFCEHIDSELGIRWIYGKTGAEVKQRLEDAIRVLGIQRNVNPFWQVNVDFTFGMLFSKKPLPETITDEKYKEYLKITDWDNHPDKSFLISVGFLQDAGSYWKATPGNVGYALMKLLCWIIQNPDGIFDGD
jgi:hypothetical protein